MRRSNLHGPHRGFALPLTLIILALLAVLSMGLSEMAGQRTRDMQVRRQLWHDERQARDIMQQYIYRLLVGEYEPQQLVYDDQILPLDGRPVEAQGFRIRVQDVAGLYGLAFYDQKRFQRILELLTDPQTALKISMELADWVDRDSRRQFRGMEAANYISKGMPQLPRNAPVRSVDELIELPSMTRDILYGSATGPGLRDLIVAGGVGYFNIATAPAMLLGPVLGLTKGEESQIMQARAEARWSHMVGLIDSNDWIFNGLSPLFHGNRYRFTLYSDGEGRQGGAILAQIKLTPYDEFAPFQLLDWSAPDYRNGNYLIGNSGN